MLLYEAVYGQIIINPKQKGVYHESVTGQELFHQLPQDELEKKIP